MFINKSQTYRAIHAFNTPLEAIVHDPRAGPNDPAGIVSGVHQQTRHDVVNKAGSAGFQRFWLKCLEYGYESTIGNLMDLVDMTTSGCQCSDSNHKRFKTTSDTSFGDNLIESECNEHAASCEMHLVLQHASGKSCEQHFGGSSSYVLAQQKLTSLCYKEDLLACPFSRSSSV